jgi:hypothetical protein
MRWLIARAVWLVFAIHAIASLAYQALDFYGNADFAAHDARWSWLRAGTNPWWIVASLSVSFVGSLAYLALQTEYVQTRLSGSSLRVTTESGNAMLLNVYGEMYCHLKVRNVGELLPSVRARLTKMDALWKGIKHDGAEGYIAQAVSPFQPVYV